jgi:outer membrane protein TolC
MLIAGLLLGPGGLLAQNAPITNPPSVPQSGTATTPAPAAGTNVAARGALGSPTNFNYSQANRGFFGPYFPRGIPELSLANSVRLHQLIREGKLYLSLEDAIALALENNLAIEVARYQPVFAQTDILRTQSGAASRGVQGAYQSSALFSGALGGGVTSGTASGGGNAGGATGGGGATNVGSVGTFDPVAGFGFGWDWRSSPLNYATVTGVPVQIGQTTSYQGFLAQRFQTGTSYVFAVGGYRQSNNSPTVLYNPVVPTFMEIGINQPLLKGFGHRANSQFIRIAKNDQRYADSTFRQQVITIITNVENAYWDLVTDLDGVGVAEQSVGLSQRTLSDNQRQVEIGTLAPIEVVRAQSELASNQQTLVVAQTTAQQQQEVLKTLLAKLVEPELAAAQILPTDKLPPPADNDIPPLEEALTEAAKNRPEIEQADINVRNQEITVKAARNALLPELDAFATYSPSGISGNSPIYGACPPGTLPFSSGCLTPENFTVTPLPVTGITTAGAWQSLSSLFRAHYPDYSAGLSLVVTLRNRSAQADAARATLEERWLRTTLQQQKNQVAQDVRSAEIAVIQAKAQIAASAKAVTLAQQTLDAERKKFQLGESTVINVIQTQRDLATAENNDVKARSAYAKALVTFAQSTGTTLDRNHIELSEAKTGNVVRTPNIPGTPSPTTTGVTQPPNQ